MGSTFIKYILEKYPDYQIINLDKLTYAGNLDNLNDIESDLRYSFIKGDITDEKAVFKILGKGVDAIINYAAETHVDRSIGDPSSFLKTEVLGTYTLLEGVKKFGISKFIQISTDEVFGQIQKGAFSEDSPMRPRNPYSAAKAGGDLLCSAYINTYNSPVIVTHSCNFYGPNHYPEKFIPLAITNVLEGRKIPVYGKGLQVREWIYAKDHCKAMDLILHKGKLGEIYNISSGFEIANISAARKIVEMLGADESYIQFVKDRQGHDSRYALSCEKIKKLGFEPIFSFEDGLGLTIKWFKENEWWWKKIKNSKDYKSYYKKQYSALSNVPSNG